MHCLIIGGGISGISTAINLAKAGNSSTIIESSPKLGGKAYSFYSKKFGCEVDNGQHLLMGCYTNTLDLIKTISAEKYLDIIKKIKIPFINEQNRIFFLESSSNYYPLDLLFSVLKFKPINGHEKFRIFYLFFDILFNKSKDTLNALDWLKKSNQTDNVIKIIWEPIAVSVFNSDLHLIPANELKKVLKQIFLSGKTGYNFVIPNVPLSQLFIFPSINYLKQHNCEIKLSEKLESIEINGNKIIKVVTNKEIYIDFDKVIFAIPPYAISKIKNLPKYIENFYDFTYSPIVSTHIKIKKNIFNQQYYSFINSPIHWVFTKQGYISLIISNANKLIQYSEFELRELFKQELIKYFPELTENDFIEFLIIKEKRATFILEQKVVDIRKEITINLINAVLAGDWTNTDLPSTIESAVKSGKQAAEKILSSN